MKKKISIIIIFFFFLNMSAFSQNMKYTAAEKTEIKIFNDFKNYVLQCVRNSYDINDFEHLNYILSHYLFIDVKTDSEIVLNHLSEQKLGTLRKNINSFFEFLRQVDKEKISANLIVLPSRLSPDKNIYSHFTSFQQKNSLVFFDKRSPAKTLGYILFLPVMKGISSTTKIWSWTLSFELGHYYFISATGEEGYEYMFER